jgi:hypothetical protein
VICADCGKDKPLDQFPRNESGPDGRHFYCKPCQNARRDASVRRHYGSNRNYHLFRKYGLRPGEVELLIEQQGGVCALCGDRAAVQVAHDHRTGKVRGVLCLLCNAGLGALKDDPEIIRQAIAYLEANDD